MQDAQSTYSNAGAPATPTAAQSVTGYPGDGLGSHTSRCINRRFRAALRATQRAPQRASCCPLGALYVPSG